MGQVSKFICTLFVLLAPAAEATTKLTFATSAESVASKPDFAKLEADPKLSLSTGTLENLTLSDLASLNQEQLDQLYARITAGRFPQGNFSETVLKVDGGLLTRISKMSKAGILARKFPLSSALKIFWSGKFFSTAGDEKIVQNQLKYNALEKFELNKLLGFVGAKLPTDESFFKTQHLRFPGKVYCGSSLIDSRRESIVIDYAYADDLKNQYLPEIDFLTGRRGLMIRDELRRVNSHLYLGRAYFNRFFIFNFVLSENNENSASASHQVATEAASATEPCGVGTQTKAAE